MGTYILEHLHMGRLHPEIHQVRDEDGGTRTYRFSYSDPPLQQMTSPDKNPGIGNRIRGVFLPEPGEVWCCHDYSQQEPKLTVHFSSLCGVRGGDEAVAYYKSRDGKVNFHRMVEEMTGVPYAKAKILDLGMFYGMGRDKLAASLGISVTEAEVILKTFHAKVPFVKGLSEYCSSLAERRGYIKLLDGARCRFTRFEPRWRDRALEKGWAQEQGKDGDRLLAPCSETEARRRVRDPDHPWQGGIRRAFTQKAMNALVQGSAARQTKLSMRALWQGGIVPMLQMHDDLNFSDLDQSRQDRVAEIMSDAVRLRVKTAVDSEYGKTWGTAKKKSIAEVLAA
jgi:DNA polymerase I-like protein with 3'-5' exonuclease and polymerase domains